MDFRILGPLEAVVDGRTLELGGARQRALFAILLLRRNEVVPSDRLLEDLYGSVQPATAHKSLQAHVSRLRKLLDPDRLRTRGSGYILEARADEVDADRFVSLLDEGRGLLMAGDPKSAEGPLEQALALWRGSPLYDVAYEEFAQSRDRAARGVADRLPGGALRGATRARSARGARERARAAGRRASASRAPPGKSHARALPIGQAGRRARRRSETHGACCSTNSASNRAARSKSWSRRSSDRSLTSNLDAGEQARPEEPAQPPPVPLPVSREARKTVTAVFFAITTASKQGERLDPEALRHITAQAFDELQDAVERHGGTVEAITAAGLSAIFGLPIVHEDDALRALRAADEARTRLTQIAVQLADTHPARLAVTVGVSTGEVMAGGRTSAQPRATGEPLMASSRLAQAGDAGDIVVDEATRRVARHAAIVEPAAVGSESAFRVVGLEFGNDGRQASGRFDSEMVGRERERRRLLDAFEQATSDRSCQLFTILGPAGVGKSRLVREVSAGRQRVRRPSRPAAASHTAKGSPTGPCSRWSRISQAWTTPTLRSKAGSGSLRCSKASTSRTRSSAPGRDDRIVHSGGGSR